MDTAILIKTALERLNTNSNGISIFELFCRHLIPIVLDPLFLPADAADMCGGYTIDGWIILGVTGKIKYAFSLEEMTKQKIIAEIKKTDQIEYQRIRFFTNWTIPTKVKEAVYHAFPDRFLTIYDKNDLAAYVNKHQELGLYIGLPLLQTGISA